MIELKLNKESMLTMYFDDIQGGKSSFAQEHNQMIATITRNEFDEFCKTNNLISYHNHIKSYEDGRVLGEFTMNQM